MTLKANLQLVEGTMSPAAQRAARARSNRIVPLIRLDHDLDLVIDDTVKALAKHGNVYQRNGRLVDVTDGKIREITPPTLREKLTSVGEFRKTKNGKWCPPQVPNDHVVQGVFHRGEWGARSIVGLSTTPFLRPDGSIVQVPGYDERSQVVFLPGNTFPEVPDSPTREQAIEALSTVLYPLQDFPWKRVKHEDRERSPALSAYIAMLLTLVLRPAIDGAIPGWLIIANTRGTGKSRLVHFASMLVFGEFADPKVFSRDDEEVRKKITAMLKGGARLAVFDNIKRPIGGESIEMALTSPVWSDRELGTMNDLRLPNLALFVFNGNNLKTAEDASRRFIPVDLETSSVAPEERTDFKVPDLFAWARENRGRVISALLTMARAWWVAGQPRTSSQSLGSFEGWASIVPHILTWLGQSSPLLARSTSDATEDTDRLSVIRLADWWESFCEFVNAKDNGVTVSALTRFLYPVDRHAMLDARKIAFREELEAMVEETTKAGVARALAYKLRSARRRRLDETGRCFDTGTRLHGDLRWLIRRDAGQETKVVESEPESDA